MKKHNIFNYLVFGINVLLTILIVVSSYFYVNLENGFFSDAVYIFALVLTVAAITLFIISFCNKDDKKSSLLSNIGFAIFFFASLSYLFGTPYLYNSFNFCDNSLAICVQFLAYFNVLCIGHKYYKNQKENQPIVYFVISLITIIILLIVGIFLVPICGVSYIWYYDSYQHSYLLSIVGIIMLVGLVLALGLVYSTLYVKNHIYSLVIYYVLFVPALIIIIYTALVTESYALLFAPLLVVPAIITNHIFYSKKYINKKKQVAFKSTTDQLLELKKLLDNNCISSEEYEAKRSELVNKL